MRHLAYVFSLALLVACSSTTPEQFVELVEESRSCGADGECVLAGAGQCTCATPVNRSAVEEVDEAAADVDCEGAQVECVAHTNIRCEAGRCISDESQ